VEGSAGSQTRVPCGRSIGDFPLLKTIAFISADRPLGPAVRNRPGECWMRPRCGERGFFRGSGPDAISDAVAGRSGYSGGGPWSAGEWPRRLHKERYGTSHTKFRVSVGKLYPFCSSARLAPTRSLSRGSGIGMDRIRSNVPCKAFWIDWL
jgi:hypothetical protein